MAIYRRNGPIRMSELQSFIQPTLQLNISQSELYRGGPNVPAQGFSGGTAGEYLIQVDSNASSSSSVSGDANEEFYIYLNGDSGEGSASGNFTITGLDVPITQTIVPGGNSFSVDFTVSEDILIDLPIVMTLTSDRSFQRNVGIGISERRAGESAFTTLIGASNSTRLGTSETTLFLDEIPVQGSGADRLSYILLRADATYRIFFGSRSSFDVTVTLNSIEFNGTAPASVNLNVPSHDINSTYIIPPNTVGDTNLRNNLLTSIQADNTVTNNWNVSAQDRNVTLNTIMDTGRTVSATGGSSGSFLQYNVGPSFLVNLDATADNNFAIGNRLFVNGGIYLIQNTSLFGSRTLVQVDIERSGGVVSQGDTVFLITGTETVSRPVIEFISRDTFDHSISASFSTIIGNFGMSTLHLESDGTGTLGSEIQLDFGAGVNPQTIDIILGGQDANGIAQSIVDAIENRHGELFADLSAPRNVRIEDSRQRFLNRPNVTVIEAGTSGLQDSDFLRFTQTTGAPPTTTFNFNRNYDNLDARPLTDGDWNFQNGSGTTASNIQPTAWPTTGNAFVAFREQPGGLLTAGGAFATFLGLSSFSGSQSFTDLTLTLTAGTNIVTYPVTAINVIGQDLIATVTAGSSRDLNGTPPANGTATAFNWLRGTFGEINTSVPESGEISLSDLYGVNDGENT